MLTKEEFRKVPRAPVIAITVLLYGCAQPAAYSYEPDNQEPRCGGIDIGYVSDVVQPGDDFYAFVNAGWLNKTEAPAGYSSFTELNALNLKTQARVKQLIDEAVASDAESGPQQKIRDLYLSYVNAADNEAAIMKRIRGEIEMIREIDTHADVARWMAEPRSHSIVAADIYMDSKNTSREAVHLDQQNLDQGVLGMPGRFLYLEDGEPFTKYRAAYVDYIEQTLQRVGMDEPRKRAERLLALEISLAQGQWDQSQLRDREANYHRMSREQLDDYAPGFPWSEFLEARSLGHASELILGTDTAIQANAKIFSQTPVDDWRSYLVFHWIDNQASFLPNEYGHAAFEFHDGLLRGVQERRPLEQRATRIVSWKLGQLIGKLYVERYFPESHRKQVRQMVEYVREAFRHKLENAAWMDEETRQHALDKLAGFDVRIGYPDRWRDYADVEITPNDLIGNIDRLYREDWKRELARLDGDAHRGEWWMPPQVVDAAYSPQINAVTFPAAILQPPLFDPQAHAAVNFGAVAAVIGHEMGHGFDDQGARFDKHGNLRNWWTEKSRRMFEARTRGLAEQYSAFSPLSDVNLDGDQTLGENIADLGGLTLAYAAYQRFRKDEGSQPSPICGYDSDQLFFMAWAKGHRAIWTEEALRQNARNSYHAPGKYRTNGVVRNIDAWYEAFNVTEDDALYLPPEQRVRLW